MKKKKTVKLTKEKSAANNLRLIKDFWEYAPGSVSMKNAKGQFVMVNEAFARDLGLRSSQIIGKTASDIFPCEQALIEEKEDAAVTRKGRPVIDQIKRYKRPGVKAQYFSVTRIPKYSQGGHLTGLIRITRDITKPLLREKTRSEKAQQNKKLELLEDVNKRKSEFIAAISHELRTPLAIIKQLFLLIFDEAVGAITDKQRELLVRVRYNIERLQKMIDSLLEISTIERQQLKLHYSLASLSDLIEDSKEFFCQKASEKNIKIEYCLPEKNVNIFVDGDRIIQVISNLINNAIKFTGENGIITVDVEIVRDKVRVGVIDSGPGIATEDLPKIFDKFVQVSHDDEVRKKGIGMGLAIVKELVEKHDGEIWVESEVGVGTRFYFTLPHFSTFYLPSKRALEKIDIYLRQGSSVYVINAMIVNYKEFVKKGDVDVEKLLVGFKDTVSGAVKIFCRSSKAQDGGIYSGARKGQYTIILPGLLEREISELGLFLKKRVREYFAGQSIANAFVVLGIAAFNSKDYVKSDGKDLPCVTIRELYIGSEMRRFKRIRYDKTNVEVIFPGKTIEVFPMVDISQGGICFMSFIAREKYKIGMNVNIKFDLLKRKKTIVSPGIVAWMGKGERLPDVEHDQFKVGVEFHNLSGVLKNELLKELKLYYE